MIVRTRVFISILPHASTGDMPSLRFDVNVRMREPGSMPPRPHRVTVRPQRRHELIERPAGMIESPASPSESSPPPDN
jgi:hypothetical protein